jgi:hypothetical protein
VEVVPKDQVVSHRPAELKEQVQYLTQSLQQEVAMVEKENPIPILVELVAQVVEHPEVEPAEEQEIHLRVLVRKVRLVVMEVLLMLVEVAVEENLVLVVMEDLVVEEMEALARHYVLVVHPQLMLEEVEEDLILHLLNKLVVEQVEEEKEPPQDPLYQIWMEQIILVVAVEEEVKGPFMEHQRMIPQVELVALAQ